MAHIELSVTRKVLDYAVGDKSAERQIAFSSPSADIADLLSTADGRHRRTMVIGGMIRLIVANRGAIWLAHNKSNARDFDALFEFLAKYPSRRMRFLVEVLDES